MRPVMGVSISTRNVSFHDRVIIREIMPIVFMNVLSSTFTLIPTVLPIKSVSLDNLDVISPDTENVWRNYFSPALFCLISFFSLVLYCFVLLDPLVHYVMCGLVLSSPVFFIYVQS